MSELNVTYQFVDGTDAEAAQVNQNFADIEAVVNGSLDAANLAAAGITAGKLKLWWKQAQGGTTSALTLASVTSVPPGTYLCFGVGSLATTPGFGGGGSVILATTGGSAGWLPMQEMDYPRRANFPASGPTLGHSVTVAGLVVVSNTTTVFLKNTSGFEMNGGLFVFGVEA